MKKREEQERQKKQRPLGEEVQRASFDVMNGWEEEGHSSFETAMGGGDAAPKLSPPYGRASLELRRGAVR